MLPPYPDTEVLAFAIERAQAAGPFDRADVGDFVNYLGGMDRAQIASVIIRYSRGLMMGTPVIQKIPMRNVSMWHL